MTHHQLGFQSSCRFQCNADADQDRGTAHGEGLEIRVDLGQEDREDRNDTQEDGTDECDLGEHSLEVIRSGLTGADARDGAVGLPQTVGDLNGIVLHGNVEVVERDDQNKVQCGVAPAGRSEEIDEVDETSGVLYGILTKGSEYTPKDTYYAFAYKDLTANSVKTAAAATSYQTLDEVKEACTIENMFAFYSECVREE